MRAMMLPKFGPPSLFEERDDIEKPKAGPGEILIKIIASGTNPVDAKIRSGDIPAVEPPAILGSDVSGTVEEVGPGVSDFEEGDEVYYTAELFGEGANGAHAEYISAPANIVAKKPNSLSHEEAAAVPLAGGTAYEAIVRRLKVIPGEVVVVHGGAGGVGSFAIQIAKASGAFVISTAGPGNQNALRELGADVAVDYTSEDISEVALSHSDGGVDAVFDTVGGDIIAPSAEYTRPFGRAATIVGAVGDLTQMYLKNQTLYGTFLTRERRRLDEITRLVEQGKIKPLVEEVLELSEVSKAHERLDSGHGRGKMVLRNAR
ncbi:MAG: zinc-binding dehydrogenase [Rubrobacteraceae bacterium]|nr:zinc-binding dehydrogenase [Rubrobacter sp.]